MPNIVRQDINSTSAIIEVTITRDELKPKVDAELKRFRQKATIKGFRQGQVPADYVRRMYGTAIFSDAAQDLFASTIYDYLRDSGLHVLGQPLPVEDQQRYSFRLNDPEQEYTVRYEIGHVPDFELKGLDNTQVFERYAISNLEELAEGDFTYTRRRLGERISTDDIIQENDFVKIAAREQGGDFETEISMLVRTIPDEALKADIMQRKAGDTFSFNPRQMDPLKDEKKYRKLVLNLTENDDRVVGDLFEGTITEVIRIQDAELNEPFFHENFGDDVNSKEEALEKLKESARIYFDEQIDALLFRDIQQRLVELNDIELPEAFLIRWLTVTNEKGLSAEAVKSGYPAFAESLRWNMITDKIKEQFGIEATDEDLRKAFAARFRRYFNSDLPEETMATVIDSFMKDKKEVEKTRENIEFDKIFSAARQLIITVDKPVSSQEFQKIMDAATKKADDENTIIDALEQELEME